MLLLLLFQVIVKSESSALSKTKSPRIKSHKLDFEMPAVEFEEQLKARDAQIKELQTKYRELKKKHEETVHTLTETQKALHRLTVMYTELQEATYRDRVIFEAKIKEEQNKVSSRFFSSCVSHTELYVDIENDSFPVSILCVSELC